MCYKQERKKEERKEDGGGAQSELGTASSWRVGGPRPHGPERKQCNKTCLRVDVRRDFLLVTGLSRVWQEWKQVGFELVPGTTSKVLGGPLDTSFGVFIFLSSPIS